MKETFRPSIWNREVSSAHVGVISAYGRCRRETDIALAAVRFGELALVILTRANLHK
ncbi:hypothetical protein [Arcanobacterium hippocoleae]|uniref:Uncharacterized protein n=1 Tax=Arcanobacterium hippocoleae TaxID=149017 RepID=A0ABU1T3C0_9ACTO|nr:hypothetical protein [Arcanobacterium hippocoleae]MDR6939894.1 hypothetical protein [Arcanobacterium hippocoleae]